MTYKELKSIAAWEEALAGTEQKPAVIFKHSTQCPVSAGALEEFEHYLEDDRNTEVDYYFVRVIESRPISNRIAEDLTVRHQSPQMIYIDKKQPVWHDSHWRITYSFLEEKLG